MDNENVKFLLITHAADQSAQTKPFLEEIF